MVVGVQSKLQNDRKFRDQIESLGDVIVNKDLTPFRFFSGSDAFRELLSYLTGMRFDPLEIVQHCQVYR